MVSNAVSRAFAQSLSETHVTVAEWAILREMFSTVGQTSPSRVAEMTGLTRGAVSKLMGRLLDIGLVIRSESLQDRRCQKIGLSEKGLKILPKLADIVDRNDDLFFQHFCLQKKTS